MANTLGNYNPIFYAQEALIQLEKALGMANRIHRGYEAERNAFEKSDTISIRKPSSFITKAAPDTDQNLAPEKVDIVLNNWREVKFSLTDQESAYTDERIINDHIRPAAVALADYIDLQLVSLYADIPWFADINDAGSEAPADIIDVRKIMFDNAVPLQQADMMHYMIGGSLEAGLLGLQAFSQFQGAGDTGVTTQLRGSLGRKFGVEIFANQNTPSHTKGTASTGALLTNGTPAVGVNVFNIDAVAVTGTLVPGDTFNIAGDTQRYAITNTQTASSNAFTGVTFTPALKIAPGDGASVTVDLDDHTANLMFHRNAFALAIAPLPIINDLGASMFTATDPITGLSIRARRWYEGDTSKVKVALDVLFGFKTLDPNLACRGRGQ